MLFGICFLNTIVFYYLIKFLLKTFVANTLQICKHISMHKMYLNNLKSLKPTLQRTYIILFKSISVAVIKSVFRAMSCWCQCWWQRLMKYVKIPQLEARIDLSFLNSSTSQVIVANSRFRYGSSFRFCFKVC